MTTPFYIQYFTSFDEAKAFQKLQMQKLLDEGYAFRKVDMNSEIDTNGSRHWYVFIRIWGDDQLSPPVNVA